MKNTDDVHKLTEAVYKNLVENFNNGIRQILLTGKAYHKALQGVSATANAYTDALSRLGSSARICRGGTEEIGEAILQIAEAQREIQTKLEESTKTLFTDLVIPLEDKLEKEFKRSQSEARKYSQGHKVVLAPCTKAHDSLKKFRKKTKNKYVYDNEKEAQHMRALGKCQEKLDEYRIQGLKSALLNERQCHCFVLQRLCSVANQKANVHRYGVNLYSSLPEWQELCANPHSLPHSAEQLLAQHMHEQYEPLNGEPGYHSNAFLHRDTRDTQSLGNGLRRSKSTHDVVANLNHFDGTKTLPPRVMMGPPPQPPGSAQVQAVYTFTAAIDNQLNFTEGDVIALMGEKSDGWQYGQNTRTQRLGWFPLSFTQTMGNSRHSSDFRFSAHQRVKSVGDLLDSRSLSEHNNYYDQDIPGNIRRPKSLYEGPPLPLQHSTAMPQAAWPSVPFHTTYNPLPDYSQYTLPQPLTDSEQIYQPIPIPTNDAQLHTKYTGREQPPQFTSPIFSSYGRPAPDTQQSFASIYSGVPSPPLPPPPSPPAIPSLYSSPSVTSTPLHPRSHTLPTNAADIRRITAPTPPPAPSNPPPPPPPPPPPFAMHANLTPPLPLSNPSTRQGTNVSSMSLLSQQNSQVTLGNRLTATSSPIYSSPARQQPSQPPPPPPPPPGIKKGQPVEDYGIEEEVNFKANPMFSSVSLRKTKTNDRSAPKI